MLLLGIDLGSSSVKASVIDGNSGKCLATTTSPTDEMKIIALKPGWAEQDAEIWWSNLKVAVTDCTHKLGNTRKRSEQSVFLIRCMVLLQLIKTIR